jgi:hypothetical protein
MSKGMSGVCEYGNKIKRYKDSLARSLASTCSEKHSKISRKSTTSEVSTLKPNDSNTFRYDAVFRFPLLSFGAGKIDRS